MSAKNRMEISEEIALENINPIGIVYENDIFWISDTEHNRMLKVSSQGQILKEYQDFNRPMHISKDGSKIYIPEFLTDTIKVINSDKVETLTLFERPDAPSAIDVEGNLIAVADFYNHRIILQENGTVTTIGKEGHNDGDLYYPTDVEIVGDLIYVGDAYNNRIQVFDKQGNSLRIIGYRDSINVATGIAVTEKQIFVTDFFGNRILIYDLEGNLMQELSGHFNKPTDIFISNNVMYVINFEGQSISVFSSF